jgi:sucrose phosphorylase
LEAALDNPNARAAKVFSRYVDLLKARAAHPAFHPNGEQQVITGNPALFCLLRTSPDGQERVLCLHNISAQPQQFTTAALSLSKNLRDIVTGEAVTSGGTALRLPLEAYEVRWLVG